MQVKSLFYTIFLVAALVLTGCGSKKSAAPGGSVTKPAKVDVPFKGAKGDEAKLLKEARRWLGTPYKYGGHSKSGTDCSGFVMEVYLRALDMKLPRSAAQMHDFSKPIAHKDLQVGDLLFFATGKSKSRVSHVGMYIGDGKMIHSSSSKGVIETNLSQNYYQRTLHSQGRVLAHSGKASKAPKPSPKEAPKPAQKEVEPTLVQPEVPTQTVTLAEARRRMEAERQALEAERKDLQAERKTLEAQRRELDKQRQELQSERIRIENLQKRVESQLDSIYVSDQGLFD